MAWTTPGTATAGEVLTAAFWNENVRDNSNDLRSYQNRYARFKRTAGDLTLNGTSWADLPTIGTTGDLTLNATAGDVVEVSISALWGAESPDGFLDFVTIVAGSPVNAFGIDGTPNNSSSGIVAWRGIGSRYDMPSGSFYRTLVSGDISGGTVTLRLRCKTGSASNRTLFASTNITLEYWARNLGPVTT
jgi:hypothetical protein